MLLAYHPPLEVNDAGLINVLKNFCVIGLLRCIMLFLHA